MKVSRPITSQDAFQSLSMQLFFLRQPGEFMEQFMGRTSSAPDAVVIG
jgi:hypothetical protein